MRNVKQLVRMRCEKERLECAEVCARVQSVVWTLSPSFVACLTLRSSLSGQLLSCASLLNGPLNATNGVPAVCATQWRDARGLDAARAIATKVFVHVAVRVYSAY